MNAIKDKMPDKSWFEKLGKLDLIGDTIGWIWDWLPSIPDEMRKIPDEIRKLPDAVGQKIDDLCTQHPDWLFCPVEPPEVEPDFLDEQEPDADITPMMHGLGQCPADISVTIHEGTVLTFTFIRYCEFASMINAIVMAISYLLAARIVIGGTQ